MQLVILCEIFLWRIQAETPRQGPLEVKGSGERTKELVFPDRLDMQLSN